MKFEIEKLEAFTGHRDSVYAVCGGDSPGKFFSVGGDGLVVGWDVKKPDIGKPLAKMGNSGYSLFLDADRRYLFVTENYAGLHVFDLTSKKEMGSMALNKIAYFDLQLYKNQLFVAGGDGVVSVIDIENMAFKKHIKVSHKSIRALAINPIEREFAAGCSDNYIRIFDLHTFAMKFQFQAHTNSVFTLAYSPDFETLLSAGRDARLKSWNLTGGYSLQQEVVAHMYAINHIAFSPGGHLFATCSMDKAIKLWNADNLKLLKVIDRARHAGHGTSVNKLCWLSDTKLVSASDDRSLSLWQIGQY